MLYKYKHLELSCVQKFTKVHVQVQLEVVV